MTSVPSTTAAPPSAQESLTADTLSTEALSIARDNADLDALLSANPFTVERTLIDSDTLHLLVLFAGSLDAPDFDWGDACGDDFQSAPITGAHVVVNVAERTVVAMSPRWGDESCIPLPDTEG